jgi:hypothetical protein
VKLPSAFSALSPDRLSGYNSFSAEALSESGVVLSEGRGMVVNEVRSFYG